jgi:hypothetical protein
VPVRVLLGWKYFAGVMPLQLDEFNVSRFFIAIFAILLVY